LSGDNLVESVKFDSDYRIRQNAHMRLCQAPCRIYRRIDVGIGSHLAYVNGELGIRPIKHLGNETHPQQ
jgi:hypothetical protein